MNSRERAKAAIRFQYPDKIPILYLPTDVGLYEHGTKLLDLWKKYPQDFGDITRTAIPRPDPADFQPDGSYRMVKKDVWGVEWEYRIFGIMGHPFKRPLDDWKNLASFQLPPVPTLDGKEFKEARESAQNHKKDYYLRDGWVSIFEVMHALRRFEDVLMDIAEDNQEINHLADIITGYWEKMIKYYLAIGVDGIQFGDDFGTQSNLLMNLQTWRRFFKPRYARLMKPIQEANRDIFFHTCGHTLPLIDDLSELGINVFWPQLNCNDNQILAEKCQKHRICLLAHPDRQTLLPFGTPGQIEAEIERIAKQFKQEEGGLIFYGEVDNNFPFKNIEALYASFYKWR